MTHHIGRKRKYMQIYRTLLLLPLITITLFGCVIPIPNPAGNVIAGKPVTAEQLAFIELEKTTKEVVLKRLGEPQIIWEDARIFVYEWNVSHGVLIWAVGAGYSGGFGAVDITARQVLIVQFGDTGRVHRFERSTRPALKSYGDFLREWASQPRLIPLEER